MKTELNRYIHSYIDLITNSSTAIFVCPKDTEMAKVLAILYEALDRYRAVYGDDCELCDLFSLPHIVLEEDYALYDEYSADEAGCIAFEESNDNSTPDGLRRFIETELGSTFSRRS